MNLNRVNEILDLPKEVGTEIPKITMLGFDEVIIENYKGILEYEEFFIRISTYIGNININGFELKLNQISDESVSITGRIENLDFEKRWLVWKKLCIRKEWYEVW